MLMRPFSMDLDFKTGELLPHDRTNIRKLSDMKGMFFHTESELRILEEDDPVIYSFTERILPEENGHLQLATTTISAGKASGSPVLTVIALLERP
jgi:oxalate decarboxylase/phosphoglucose isomerase-like protein (cupin superfamily)